MRVLTGLRFHLSTAFICMIVAALLVLLNVLHWPTYTTYQTGPIDQLATVRVQAGYQCGWPFAFFETETFNRASSDSDSLPIKKLAFTFDILIFLAIIVITAIILERRIRHRKVKN